MVVDDEPEQCKHLMANLKHVGVKQLLSAPSGKKAWEAMAALPRPVDIILADVQMPDGNGLQLLQALRTGSIKGMRANSTFLLATTSPTVGLIQAASSLDANGVIVKPVNVDKFEAALLKARRTMFPPSQERHAKIFIPDEV